MTEDDKKILTEEVLKECWHEVEIGPVGVFSCNKCGYVPDEISDNYNRTFTTPDDVFAVKDAIVKMGRWKEFRKYAHDKWSESRGLHYAFPLWSGGLAMSDEWLFRTVNEKGEPHFCQLAVDWWKEKTI